jgi:hypothetical protein
MFYPTGSDSTTFKFPDERKLRIEGCANKEVEIRVFKGNGHQSMNEIYWRSMQEEIRQG